MTSCKKVTPKLLGGLPSEVPRSLDEQTSPIELLTFFVPIRSIIGDQDVSVLIDMVKRYDDKAVRQEMTRSYPHSRRSGAFRVDYARQLSVGTREGNGAFPPRAQISRAGYGRVLWGCRRPDQSPHEGFCLVERLVVTRDK